MAEKSLIYEIKRGKIFEKNYKLYAVNFGAYSIHVLNSELQRIMFESNQIILFQLLPDSPWWVIDTILSHLLEQARNFIFATVLPPTFSFIIRHNSLDPILGSVNDKLTDLRSIGISPD